MEIQNFPNNTNKTNIGEVPTLVASPSPPSSCSNSPAHEFSFTISFHQQQTSNTKNYNKSTINSPPVSAVDLSPADDIFFHGHLLPLHLLSHLPVSPRSSTNSLDSFTLPITEFFFNDHDQIIQENNANDDIEFTNFQELDDTASTTTTTSTRVKSKSFSIFGGRKKGSERQDTERQKKKLKSEVSDVLKKYMKMLRPLLPFRGSRKSSINKAFHNQSYSFPGSVSSRKNQDELRGRRGLFSAPASMRTSPTNSGLLVATGAMASCSSSDSTMEELQAAIQSAITHCKNSIAVQEKTKCQDVI